MSLKLKLKKGDHVVVITGKDKGRTGDVLRVFPKDNLVLVQGVNVAKRHQRQTTTQEGGIVLKEMPIDVSNISHLETK